MKELNRWIDHQAKREGRVVRLEDTLLGSNFWRYATYRLRYFFLRYLVESSVHLLRFFVLFFVFSPGDFFVIVTVLASAGLATSFWWGALESMRERVRLLNRTERHHLVSREVGSWLSFSIQLSLLVGFFSICWLTWELLSHGVGLAPVDVYLFSILFRLALNFATRCYHSGVYSLRRVYRPPLAIVAVEVVGIGLAVALWPWLAAWGVAIGNLLAGAFSVGVTVYYTSRAYRYSRLDPLNHLSLGKLAIPFASANRNWIYSGFSYAIMRLDSLLILGLFASSLVGLSPRNTELFALFFVSSPTIRAGFDWAQLFYFDLKRLEVDLLQRFKARFERNILRLSLLLGLLLGILGTSIGVLTLQTGLGLLQFLLLPFFVIRSVLAALQIEAFSAKEYLKVILSGSILTSGLSVSGFLITSDLSKLNASIALMTIVAVFIWLTRRYIPSPGHSTARLLPTEWLAFVSKYELPVQIKGIKLYPDFGKLGAKGVVDDRQVQWRKRRLLERFTHRLGTSGKITQAASESIIWCQWSDSPDKLDEMWLGQNCGGYLKNLWKTGVQENGLAALQAASRFENFSALETAEGSSAEAVRTEFLSMFSKGIAIDPGSPTHDQLTSLSTWDRGNIFRDAQSYVETLQVQEKTQGFETTALCPGGDLKLIFVVPKSYPLAQRKRWRRRIDMLNRSLSLNSLTGQRRLLSLRTNPHGV